MIPSSASARRLGARAGWTLPLRLLFALAVVTAMILLSGALLWQAWTNGRNALLSATLERAALLGQLITERVENRALPGTVALEILASDGSAVTGGPDTLLDHLGALRPVFASMPFLSSITFAYGDGNFVRLMALDPAEAARQSAPEGTRFLAHVIEAGIETGQPATGSSAGVWRFFDKDMRLIGARAAPAALPRDPRQRDWYVNAMAAPGQHVTAPYVFPSTGEVGVTASRKVGGVDAVIGLDLSLTDIARELEGLRPTPGTEVAIVDAAGWVIAYAGTASAMPDMIVPLRDLRLGPLVVLDRIEMPSRRPASFSADGQEWLGVKAQLNSRVDQRNTLVMAVPRREVLAPLRASLERQMWVSGGIALGFIVIGWFAGRRLGQGLNELALQAQRLTRFDFGRPAKVGSFIREIADFHQVLDTVGETIRDFLTTSETIACEPQLDRMLEQVLAATVKGTSCTRGLVYLVDGARRDLVLAADVREAGDASAALPEVLSLSVLDAPEQVAPPEPDGTQRLALPLRDRKGRPVGLLVLVHGADAAHQSGAFVAFARQLSGTLAISIETRRLMEEQSRLLEGLIHLVADAIDAKSPYTGAHCRRVPELADMIVSRMAADEDGPYRDFALSEEERRAFRVGSWLHDCGKVTSPEHIIDKATKLEAVHNRIHEVRTRFEVLLRDARIAHLTRLAAGEDAVRSAQILAEAEARLADDFAFVARSNVGGEFMTDEALARLAEIATRTWTRHFDDRLGLSREEEAHLAGHPAPALPAEEHLLADKPEHVHPWEGVRPPVEKGDPANHYGFDMRLPPAAQNLGELYNLSIRRGTLNDEERFKVNDHVVQTYIMLKALPWPEGLERVPELAATHHERMDGKGYPRRIAADGLSLPERVMAVADVFEALTASDRPYKPAKTLSEAMRILVSMGREGHLDPQVVGYFLRSRLWETYAGRFLRADQHDAVDVAGLCGQLQAAG